MSKLVEHGNDVGEADQGGLAFGWLRQIGDIVDDRGGSEQRRLADEFRHPGSAILIVALEIVAVEKSQVLTIGVENLKHPHIGLVDGKVMPLFEGDAIELIGGVKDAVLQYTVEFEVGLYLRIIDVEAGFADLLGVEVPVIGLNLEATLLGIDDGLDVFRFASGLCSGGGEIGR